jgi:hypothetical protein
MHEFDALKLRRGDEVVVKKTGETIKVTCVDQGMHRSSSTGCGCRGRCR